MAQPAEYTRRKDFTDQDGDDTDHNALNQEFDAAALSINGLRDNLALIQKDDGSLKNGIVGKDQLADNAFDGFKQDLDDAVARATTAAEESTRSAVASGEFAAVAQSASQSAAQSEENAAASAANAAGAAKALFDGIYLGSLSSDPTVDGNGQPLTDGDFYFNNVAKLIRTWDATTGAFVNATPSGQFKRQKFAAGTDFTPGTTTSLTLASDPQTVSNIFVHFDAAFQQPSEYSLSGQTLTFTSPIPVGVQSVAVAYLEAVFIPITNAILSFPDYAAASAAAATLPDGQAVGVESDETRDNLRTRYKIENGVLVYVGLDADASSTSYGGGSVGEALDNLNQTNDGAFVAVSVPVGSDGTAALQAAIDAWAMNPNLEVRIIGVCDVQGTVQVPNKETDNPEKRLTITGGSLKKTNAGFMFTKKAGQQLPDSTPLQTGHITFDNVRFLGPRGTAGTFIFDGDNIIRTKFVNCYGDGIQLAYATGYLQSIYVDTASVFRKWSGWLFDCGHLFDVKWYGTAEAGQSFMRTRDTAADPAANSLTVRGCIEGLSGKVFEVGVCFGVVIDGNYQEANAGGDYDFSIGTGYHKGLTLIGNGFQPSTSQLSDPNYYPVKLGKGAPNSITLIGNSSTGNLFDIDAGNQSAVVDAGNWCAAGKKKFSRVSRLFDFDGGLEQRFRLSEGSGVGLHAYYSKVGFENARETVGGESITAGITIGPANPQTSPASYSQKNWVKGSIVWSSSPVVTARQYGTGIVHDALIMGWQCTASGTPGVWREIAVMLPY